MFTYSGYKYFEEGDSVIQDSYEGCPAIVASVTNADDLSPHGDIYILEVDTSNYPEALDDDGNQIQMMFARVNQRHLNSLNR